MAQITKETGILTIRYQNCKSLKMSTQNPTYFDKPLFKHFQNNRLSYYLLTGDNLRSKNNSNKELTLTDEERVHVRNLCIKVKKRASPQFPIVTQKAELAQNSNVILSNHIYKLALARMRFSFAYFFNLYMLQHQHLIDKFWRQILHSLND